jgi:hypothetical protein
VYLTPCRLGCNSALHSMKVQLGGQTDSKMLLGSYRCTDLPSEFVWQPSVLTQVRILTGQLLCFTVHHYVWVILYSLDTRGSFHRNKVAGVKTSNWRYQCVHWHVSIGKYCMYPNISWESIPNWLPGKWKGHLTITQKGKHAAYRYFPEKWKLRLGVGEV